MAHAIRFRQDVAVEQYDQHNKMSLRNTSLCIRTAFGAIAYNVPLVCDAAPSLTKARGRCGDEARRSAAEPEAPSEAPMHIRAVMRSGELKKTRDGWFLFLSRGKYGDEVVHTHDLDHPECAKVQEMFVPSNQVVGLRRNGAVDELIVTRIINNHIEVL